MTYGTLAVGRVTLTESPLYPVESKVNAQTLAADTVVTGQESSPPLTAAQLQARREDLSALMGQLVPVRFTSQTAYDGWYQVTDVGASQISWGAVGGKFDWSLSLTRIGTEYAVDAETSMVAIARDTDHVLTPETWHATPVSGHSYWTGTTQPSAMTRNGIHGPVPVYRAVPAGANPRWACPLAAWYMGAACIQIDDIVRAATDIPLTTEWVLHNTLIAAWPGDGGTTLNVASWDGSTWEPKAWNVCVGASGTPITTWSAGSVLRNDPEMCTIRLVANAAPGRTLLDLTVRRGSRFVEGHLQTDRSTVLAVLLGTSEALTNMSTYVVATSNDAAGNKVTCGTAAPYTYVTSRGIQRNPNGTSLDFYVGSVVGGSSSASGDDAATIRDQYHGCPAVATTLVRR